MAAFDVEPLKERLRQRLAEKMPDVRFSFEPSDIVNEVMSFGSPTAVEVAVSGPNLGRQPRLCREDSRGAGEDYRFCAISRSASPWITRRFK